MRRRFAAMVVVPVMLGLSGCQATIPKDALQLTPDTLERRQMQTRVFETPDEATLLAASSALLQDLGFNLDESETQLGILVASKDRDATEAGQIVGAVFIAVLFGVAMPVDNHQKIRASVVTRKLDGRDGYAVRLTLQRVVWNTQGQISKTEPLDQPEIYQEFFAKLSKAVFFEAQEL